MNPVKANIVKNENEYKYSSYNDYLKKSGFLNQRILNFLFLKPQNYIEKFKSIPYKNIYDNKIVLKNILDKFLTQENICLNQLRKKENLFEKFISYLNSNKYNYSKQELADILEISRATLYRKIKKVKAKNGEK